MKKITIYITLALLLIAGVASAQSLKRANKFFNAFSYEKAIKIYQHVWEKDSSNFEVVKKIADSYRMTNNMLETEKWYGRLVKSGNAKPDDYLYYIEALESNEKYAEAKKWLEEYKKETGNNVASIDLNYIDELKRDSARYEISPVSVNSPASDFGVAYAADSSVVFASAKHRRGLIKRVHNWNNQDYLRLYKAEIAPNGDLKKPKLLSRKLETTYHDGSVCYSPDGTEMFITRNYVKGRSRAKKNSEGVVTLKMYYSKKVGKKWTEPKEMALNMKEYSSGLPSISADGNKLFFVSDRPGGFGGTDIYVVTRDDKDDAWGEPVNVGKDINTSENEMFPFINSDGTLYFSSKGYSGLGGLDIYSYSPKQGVKNMGYPINSEKDDFSFVIKGKDGYFASNRKLGETYDDIYKFSVVACILKGEVFDEYTKLLLPYTTVSLVNSKGEVVKTMKTGADAKFRFLVKDVADYTVKSVIPGYTDGIAAVKALDLAGKTEHYVPVYQSNSLFLDGVVLFKRNMKPLEGVSVNISLDGVPVASKTTNTEGHFYGKLLRDKNYTFSYYFGKHGFVRKTTTVSTHNIKGDTLYVQEMLDRLQIEDIYYDFDKSNIRPDAAEILDQLVMIMKENPGMKVELGSHTDSRGSDAYNIALSDRRAKSAVRYIVERGIDSDRITARGYGETQLVNRCSNGVKCSKAEHQANRRTEIKLLEL